MTPLLAAPAQPLEVDDGHPAIFEPQQALLLQPLQALVGVLPRMPESADFSCVISRWRVRSG
jgi:hypothetical protein